MLGIDWRSSADYRHANTITAAGFAWEYLRRDDDYHRDFQSLMRKRNVNRRKLEQFSQRWGLRFPKRS